MDLLARHALLVGFAVEDHLKSTAFHPEMGPKCMVRMGTFENAVSFERLIMI